MFVIKNVNDIPLGIRTQNEINIKSNERNQIHKSFKIQAGNRVGKTIDQSKQKPLFVSKFEEKKSFWINLTNDFKYFELG